MVNRQHLLKKIDKDPDLTSFQKKVLKSVLNIPKGEVRSYLWIAQRVGNPKASRAVGNAVGKNPYAPHVPCHRVIRSDGSIGGYAGGMAKKKQLLNAEGIEIRERGKKSQPKADQPMAGVACSLTTELI